MDLIKRLQSRLKYRGIELSRKEIAEYLDNLDGIADLSEDNIDEIFSEIFKNASKALNPLNKSAIIYGSEEDSEYLLENSQKNSFDKEEIFKEFEERRLIIQKLRENLKEYSQRERDEIQKLFFESRSLFNENNAFLKDNFQNLRKEIKEENFELKDYIQFFST